MQASRDTAGYTVIDLPAHLDDRGALLPVAFDELPFVPRRMFTISLVPSGTRRGGHSHRRQQQLLLCPQGRVQVELTRPGAGPETVTLDQPGRALLVDAGTWAAQTYEGEGSVLVVLASGAYDPDELDAGQPATRP